MNLMMSLFIEQLLNESQQLRKKFVWNLQSSTFKYRVKKTFATQKETVSVKETISEVMMKAFKMTVEALKNDEKVTSVFIIT